MNIDTRRVRSGGMAALIAITLSVSVAAQQPAITITNFAKVSDTYFRGAQPVGGDYADLAALGVKTIINLIGDGEALASEKAAVEQNGMRYVYIPMSTRRAPTEKELTTFLSVVGDPASGPVYVHCVGGKHRTGVMTAVYRMNKDGLSGEQAFREMKQFDYGPDFLHPEFKKFIYGYQVPKTAVAVTAGTHQ